MRTLSLLVLLFLPCVDSPGQEVVVSSTDTNGSIEVSGAETGTVATIVWAASLTEPGRSDWHLLSQFVVTGAVTRADIPMYFRVRGTPKTPKGFAFIPAGTFTMGSPTGEPGRETDETQHTVTLTKAFFLQRTEVTWLQWNTVRDWALTHGYTDLPTGWNGNTGAAGGTYPVTEVSWWDAVKWLNAWSEQEGLTPCYTVKGNWMRTGTSTPVCYFSANGYRLPTESEWEYACRAGTTTAFYTGRIQYTGSSPVDPKLDLAGWYGGNSGDRTHPVGLKAVNDLGLYDTHGNVYEWCWDGYGTYPTGSVNDPTGPASGSTRVIRGGDWGSYAQSCRSAIRSNKPPDYRYSNYGFRPARSYVP